MNGFRDLKAEVLRRIRSRRWPPGHLLPPEPELAQKFGVARATVNRALRELAEEGALDRKRRAGTRVALAPVRRARLEIPLVRAEIEATGARYGYRLLSRQTTSAPAWLRARSGLEGKVLHLKCLHLADGMPHQVEDRWISLAAVPSAAAESFTGTNPNEWLVATVPFTTLELVWRAAAASREIAKALKIKPAAPVFVAERTTWHAGKPVTFAAMSFPETYRLTTRVG